MAQGISEVGVAVSSSEKTTIRITARSQGAGQMAVPMRVARGVALGGHVGAVGRDRAAGLLVQEGELGEAVVLVVEDAVAVVAP